MAVTLQRSWTAADGTSWLAVGFRKVLGADVLAVVASNTGHCGSSAAERVFLVEGVPTSPGHKVAVDLTWSNATGASRVPGLCARWKADGTEGYVAEIDSNLGETRVRIRRRKGGAWTDLTGWQSIFDAPQFVTDAVLEAGITAELRVEDETGQVALSLRIDGDEVLAHDDNDADRLEREGTVGVLIDGLSTLDDVEYDSLFLRDFEDEYSGVSADLGEGLSLVVDGVYYAEADLEAAKITIGRGGKSFTKDDVWEFATPALVDAADGILYPGAVVQVAIEGEIQAHGRIGPTSRALKPGEGRVYELMSARALAAEVPIEDPDTGAQSITWNLPTDSAEYVASRAGKTTGQQIKFLLDEHVNGPTGLRAHLAAPPDEDTDPYVQAELDLLTSKLPGQTASMDVLAGVEQLLAKTRYALKIDPATLVWHFVPRLGGTVRTLDFDAEHMTGEYSIDRRKNRTAVLVTGTRPETADQDLDNLIEAAGEDLLGGLVKGWPESLEATHTAEKAKRNRDTGTVQSVSGSGAAVSVTPDPGTLALEAHEWIEGTLGFQDGDEAGEVYDIEDNSGSALDVVGPWRNGGPAMGDTFVVSGNAKGGGRDNGHVILGYRYELDDVDLGVPKDACAQVRILTAKADFLTSAKITTPTDPTKKTEVMLNHPAIGLVNYAAETKPDSCVEGSAVEEARVSTRLPTFSRSAPRVPTLWFPTSAGGVRGYRGSAYANDPAKYDGGGRPGKGDVGCMTPELWDLPEFDGSADQLDEVEAACAELLTFLSPLARSVVLTVKNTLSIAIDIGDRLQVLGGPPELEDVEDLDVLAIEWDPVRRTTTYYCGTVAAGEYDLQAMRRDMLGKNLTRANKRSTFNLQQIANCLQTNLHSAGYAQGSGQEVKCGSEVSSGVTKAGRTVIQDLEGIIKVLKGIGEIIEAQKGGTFVPGDPDDINSHTKYIAPDSTEWYLGSDGLWHEGAIDGPTGSPWDSPDDFGAGTLEGIMWAAILGILGNLGKTIDMQTGKVIPPGTVNNGTTNPGGHDWVTFGPDGADPNGDPERTPVDDGETVPPTTEVAPDAFSLLSLVVNGILHNLGKTVTAAGVVLVPGSTTPGGGATRYNPDGSTTPVDAGDPVPDEELTKLGKNKAAIERLLLGHEPGEDTDHGPKITDKPGGGFKVSSSGYERIDGSGPPGPQIGGAVGGLGGKCGSTFDGKATFGSGPGTILVPGSTVGEDGGYYHPPTNDEDDVQILEEGHEVPASTQQQALALAGGTGGLTVHDAADIGGVVYTDAQVPDEGNARYWRVEPATVRFREVEEDVGAGLNDGDWAWTTPALYYEPRDWSTWKRPVRLATTAALVANTKSGTTILEANANGAMANIDGTAPAVGDRLLLKDEADASKRGIYVVDSLGGASSKWKLKRSADADTADELVAGMLVYVQDGSANHKKVFRQFDPGPLVPHTDGQAWEEFGASGGGSTPTGTGFRHVTSGTEDAATKLVETADVHANTIDPAAGTAGLRTLGTGAAQAAAGDDTRLTTVEFPWAPFIKSSPAASQTAQPLLLSQIGGSIPLPAGATLVGISAGFSGTFSAGTIKFRVRKNGTGDATIELILTGTTSGYVTGTGVSFAAADLVGCEFDTDGTYNGTVGGWGVLLWFKMTRL